MAQPTRQGRHSLYSLAASAFALQYSSCVDKELSSLPSHILLDVISLLHASGRPDCLRRELSSLEAFRRLHACPGGGTRIHQCFQQLGSEKKRVAVALADAFAEHSHAIERALSGKQKVMTAELKGSVQLGLALGSFLTDVGYLPQAGLAYKECLTLLIDCPDDPQLNSSLLTLDCYRRLLRTLTMDRAFGTAESLFSAAHQIIDILESGGTNVNVVGFYTAAAELYFVKNSYDQAFYYSRKALNELDCSLSIKVIVDTLRQCAVTSVMKRDFPTAAVFAKQALRLAKHTVGDEHPCYADALLNYGFYLLNADCVEDAVIVYEEAIKKRQQTYGTTSFLTAFCYEDLAYALYLHEYNSGEFARAFELLETSMRIYRDIFSNEHMILGSAKRTKALILEEMAMDHEDGDAVAQLLDQAWHLHTDVLRLAIKAFGENNAQTAKHYGNLARLYQSFGQFDKAQALHLKAIKIKERVHGEEHYEVALSIGHLASLYNYDMQLHDEAEKLYLRSVALSLQHFGPTYSGLEYDYRGLIWLYTFKNDLVKANRYQALLNEWSDMRVQKQATDTHPLSFLSSDEDSCTCPTVSTGLAGATASPLFTSNPRLALRLKAPHPCTLPLCCTILPRLRPTDAS